MKTTSQLVAVAALTSLMLVVVAACEKEADVKGSAVSQTSTTSASALAKASCDMRVELGTCNEYRNGPSFGLEKSLCEGFHGKFSNAGCTTEGQIGSCAMSEGEVKRYYGSRVADDHALTVGEARGDCESEIVKGRFMPAPNAAAAAAAPSEPAPKND